MRAVLAVIGILVLIVVMLIALGMLNLDINGGKLPSVTAETGSVAVGESNTMVRVPTVEMKEKQVSVPTIDVQPAPSASATPAP
ncbi:hypothetical protein ACX40Y_01795 [Sphingomonas sp. RS6]